MVSRKISRIPAGQRRIGETDGRKEGNDVQIT
jgi:hypothetical protein